MKSKVCRICKENKLIEMFSKRASSKDGHMNICKFCDSEKANNWYSNNTEKTLIRLKKYRQENKEIILQKNRDKYYNNKDAILVKRKEHYLINKEDIKERNSKYQKENREINRKAQKKHYSENKPKYMEQSAVRRAKKLRATLPWINEIHKMQIQWYYEAARMMTDTSFIRHHVDHIHPIQGNGFTGLHVPWNLRVIKAEENLSKGNKLPMELSHLMWESA